MSKQVDTELEEQYAKIRKVLEKKNRVRRRKLENHGFSDAIDAFSDTDNDKEDIREVKLDFFVTLNDEPDQIDDFESIEEFNTYIKGWEDAENLKYGD